MQKHYGYWMKQVSLGLLFALTFWAPAVSFAGDSALEQRILALEKSNGYDEDLRRSLSWLKKFKPSGDLRLRHESLFRQGSNATGSKQFDRSRQRIRFRIGGEYFFNSNIKVGFRLATGGTGGGTATSTNQTLTNTFGTKSLDLDKAYADWKIPYGNSSLNLRGGKFGVPFMKSEQIWDGDVTVEGAAEKLAHKRGNTTLELILGQFVLEEFSPSATASGKDDMHLFAYQGIVSQKLSGLGKAKVGVALYDFQNFQGNILTGGAGNNSTDGTNFVSNYDILNILAEFSTDMVIGIPVKVFGGYVQNLADSADNLENDGWEAGVKVGKSVKNFGDWQVKYMFRNTGADAVPDALNDSDIFEGATNSEGSEVGLNVGLYKGILLGLTYMDNKSIIGAEDHLQLFQADIILQLF